MFATWYRDAELAAAKDPAKLAAIVDARAGLVAEARKHLGAEFKADLNAYLAALEPDAPVHSLAEVIAFNEAHRDTVMPYFGQEILLRAQEKGPLSDQAYLDALGARRVPRFGEQLDLVLDASALHLFDPDTERRL